MNNNYNLLMTRRINMIEQDLNEEYLILVLIPLKGKEKEN